MEYLSSSSGQIYILRSNQQMDKSKLQAHTQLTQIYLNKGRFTKYLFTWMNEFISFGYENQIQQPDIFHIQKDEEAATLYKLFEDQLRRQILLSRGSSLRMTFLRALFRSFSYDWVVLIGYKITLTVLSILQPIVFAFMVRLYDDKGNISMLFQGLAAFIVWIFAIYGVVSCGSFYEAVVKAKIQVAVITKIYNSLLTAPLPLPPVGELTNLIQIDSLQICNLANCLIVLTILPFQIIGAIAIYFILVGNAASVGTVGVLVNLIISVLYGKIYQAIQDKIMASRDQRVKGIEEMLNGISTIKQNSFYDFFYKKIKEKRETEMDDIKWQSFLTQFMIFLFSILPVCVLFTTFKLFNIFNLTTVLIVQQNYMVLTFAIMQIPTSLSSLLLALTSIDRVMKFFSQLERKKVTSINTSQQIAIQNGTFQWHQAPTQTDAQGEHEKLNQTKVDVEKSPTAFKLDEINFEISQGQMVLVLGGNGSGKTSLINALLGEMACPNSTRIQMNGSISLAAQEPWIMQTSVKNNIILDNPLNLERFVEAINMAQLTYDLATMPAGHNTEIGEKGQTLSGGQRKRVHLARAFYLERDIYILDNPCSALDHTTGHQIAQAVKNNLKGKTRLVTSSSAEYWSFADLVICLEDGKIVFKGSFAEFKQSPQSNEFLPHKEVDKNEPDPAISVRQEEQQKLSNQEVFENLDKSPIGQIMSEDRTLGSIDGHVFKAIYILYGKCLVLLVAILLSVLAVGVNIFYQLKFTEISSVSSDENATDQKKQDAVDQFLVYLPACGISVAVLTLLCGLFLVWRGAVASKTLHNNITNNLLRASVQYFYNFVLGSRIKNRLTNDIYQFDMNTPLYISQIFNLGFLFLAMVIACILLASVYCYPVFIVYIFFEVWYTVKYIKIYLEVSRIQAISKSPILNQMSETSQGVVFVRHCQDKTQTINQFYEKVNTFQRNQICSAALATWYKQILFSLMILMYVMVVVVNYVDPSLSKSQAIVSAFIALQVGEAFMGAMVSVQMFYSDTIYFERCLFLAEQVPTELDDQKKVSQNDRDLSGIPNNSGIELIPMAQQDAITQQEPSKQSDYLLELKNLNVKYREDFDFVIRDFTLCLGAKQKLAVIGRTGSGKTSLVQCITRLITPLNGQINLNGTDYNDQKVEEIRAYFSVVSQDPFTFEGTVKENIDPKGLYTEKQILSKLEQYQLNKVELLTKFSFRVEPNGSNLSLGERQLIVLCRVILQPSEIVILDECTGNLDYELGNLIDRTLQQYVKEKTVIGITHKLEQLELFDHVMLINRGMLVAQGKKEEMIKNYFSQQL